MINLELLKLLTTKDGVELSEETLDIVIEEYFQEINDLLFKAVTLKADSDPLLKPYIDQIDSVLQSVNESSSNDAAEEAFNSVSRIIFDAALSSDENQEYFNKVINDFDAEFVDALRDELSEEQDAVVQKYLINKLDELEEEALVLLMSFVEEQTRINVSGSNQIYTKLS